MSTTKKERKLAGANEIEPKVESENQQETDEELAIMARKVKQHKKWNRRLNIFFCCLGYKKHKESIADIASILADFYADLDVPSSDIAAGFSLLSKYQEAQRQWIIENNELGVTEYLSSIAITPQTKFVDISTAEDSHLVNDLIYYMNYSLAIFGWPLQVIDDPCMLCCIFPYLKLSRCCGRKSYAKVAAAKDPDEQVMNLKKKKDRKGKKNSNKGDEIKNNSQQIKQSMGSVERDNIEEERARRSSKPGILNTNVPIIVEDNCCGCNAASFERRLAAHNYEIIYVTYKVDVNIVPFLVVADHSKQSIVVALRGSMSLSDMVTDMNGQSDKLPIDDCPDGWLCHRGIARTAEYVKKVLQEEHILDRAFNCRPDLGSQDYNLILCGHSLGAGVAAVLGILMKKEYPSLKAYLYSPPGGVLSLPAIEYTKQFATGIMLGNDCVPRLGLAQLERLRYYVLLSLKSSEKSAGKILTKALFPTCCLGGNKVEYDPNQSLDLLYGKEGRSFDYNGKKIPFQLQPQILYAPGRLIHVVKNHSFKSKARKFFNGPIYQAVWSENTTYDRIMIGEGMLFDHLPNNLMHAMKMLFSNTLPGRKEPKAPNSNRDSYDDKQPMNSNHNDNVVNKMDDERIKELVIENDGIMNKTHIISSDENNNQDLKVNEKTDIEVTSNFDKKLVDSNGNDEAFANQNEQQVLDN